MSATDELQTLLTGLVESYRSTATDARGATVRGEDATPHWVLCQRYWSAARWVREQILLEEWLS